MVDAGKKTGSSTYFKPLCRELNKCFGTLKDVNPDQLFSSRHGTHVGNPVEVDDDDTNANNSNAETPQPGASKKKPRSNYQQSLYLLKDIQS